MEWLDYREKLGIGYGDQQKVKFFLTKMFNVLEVKQGVGEIVITDSEYIEFCNMTATPVLQDYYRFDGYSMIMSVLRENSVCFEEFIAYYIAFINCQKHIRSKKNYKKYYKNLLCKMLEESRIPYEVLEENGSFFIFPRGVKEFDDALVTEILLWLKDYPLSHKAWVTALKDYSETTELKASETADKFRKALERFFQEFFESEKSIENLKSEYGTFLSSKGVPAELKNNFEKLLEAYTNYINNYAKHHDKVSRNVLEYIMYQTGNIMRLLITLKDE